MIQISDDQRRRAFTFWLRTGRVPNVNDPDGIELKFNPWHDPDDGRFTFAGAGRKSGQGSLDASERGTAGAAQLPRRQPDPSRPHGSSRGPVGTSSPPSSRSPKGGWGGGGFTGGGGGSGGGGGATSTEPWPVKSGTSRGSTGSGTTDKGANRTGAARTVATTEQFRTETRNGYTYEIDGGGRTRRVSGSLASAGKQVRSRVSQRQAGGPDRRSTDDGGHYIAVRFNGPTESFNHFAQDANFNRGGYRVLENDWGRATRAGQKVTVKIVPVYERSSTRPAAINVWFTIDGRLGSQQFRNEPKGKHRGK
ncbi:DNA/RNA non-specific endonuclease [Sphingomonas sp. Tas61C01]|uniref:DNA/RNA non-specific endonuclease n=1 Tax=Sphingomonas sp. Tas61C01 TaxID=3458297 RepID=UPI00403EAD9F